jgi:uncharacterized membrane protein
MSTYILSTAHIPRRAYEIPHLPALRPFDWLRRGFGDLVAMPGVSLAYGAAVAALAFLLMFLTIGIATWYLGLMVVVPWLGYATWHACRDTLVPQPTATADVDNAL